MLAIQYKTKNDIVANKNHEMLKEIAKKSVGVVHVQPRKREEIDMACYAMV